MPKAVYLHIPFCDYICHYCDFNKVFMKGQPVEEYLDHMAVEMKNTVKKFPYDHIETIFIGGGTPTALSASQLDVLLESVNDTFHPGSHIEYTVEANPGSVDEEKLSVLKNAGVNRLSIGAQAFQNDLLKRLGRGHDEQEVVEIVKLAQRMGFDNLSLDLMFGLPDQTMDMFRESIERTIQLDIPHVSSYSLQVEKKTVFYNLFRKDQLPLPTQEEEADMFELLISKLEKAGLQQYEISNFARPGFESKHNMMYWKNEHYYGVGAGAHSYMNGVRRINAGPLKKYIQLVDENGFPYTEENELTTAEKMEEEMFMGLRMKKGVSVERFQEKFNIPLMTVFGSQIDQLHDKGLINLNKGNISLTEKGLFLGNEVFSEFLGVVEE
ncbi:radical SAM family heme chaperone HemW [Pseudalkalibacillus caeni]|uniref:Heme chaperone HemW n=1 Tax=Exobacillus caeni TaxID=2574798 RepID=A0A5R9FB52_9BACL|nr:radical SAM family heme chaperone HemW [Pseudalkalibacillus caeni]TLS39426.1 oxygen-independent coproporphyrinogen III oxidase [Pseudalkalibacillus caeni]